MEGTHTGAVNEERQPTARTNFGAVNEGLTPIGQTHTGAGEEREHEGAADTKCYELTVAPITCPPVLPRGVRVQKNQEEGVRLSLGRGEVCKVVSFVFVTHHPTLFLPD